MTNRPLLFSASATWAAAWQGGLLEAGYPLTVSNRDSAKTALLSARGAMVAASPRQAAEDVEIVIAMLANDEAVNAVVLGADGVFAPGQLLVLRPGRELVMRGGTAGARAMLLGGEPMDGPRTVLWNFVSSSIERIEQAKEDWRQQRFARVPGETEFIPLPDLPGKPIFYP